LKVAPEVRLVTRSVLAALGGCLLLAGCGGPPPLGRVTGKVTFRGVAVAEGAVVFSDDRQGVAYVSDLDADGSFAFQVAQGHGLPPGEYAVAIRPPRPNKPALGFVAPNTRPRAEPPDIPKKYHEHKTSGFSAVVKPGANEPYLFDMR
jgi:hypothetical protein